MWKTLFVTLFCVANAEECTDGPYSCSANLRLCGGYFGKEFCPRTCGYCQDTTIAATTTTTAATTTKVTPVADFGDKDAEPMCEEIDVEEDCEDIFVRDECPILCQKATTTTTAATTTKATPVAGGWSSWSPWTPCTTSCGEGERTRTRTKPCDNPLQSSGGRLCIGPELDIETCNLKPCLVDGGWSSWSPWTTCTTSCGEGERTRTRTKPCDNPLQSSGGRPCIGPELDIETCNLKPCLVDGGWSSLNVQGEKNLQNEQCPKDYVEIETRCFIFHDVRVKWQTAQAKCVKNAALLAEVKNPEALRAYVMQHFPSSNFWVGGVRKSDGWQWLHGNHKLIDASFPWGTNNAGVLQGRDRGSNCMVLKSWRRQKTYGYADNKCGKKHGFICERSK